jgi:hypothetical protein
MRTRSRSTRKMAALPVLALVLLLVVGCEEPRNVGGKKAAAPPPPKDNFIVGKTTQDIKEATPESTQGSQQANMKITAKDPITLQGNAYVTSVGRIAIMRIDDAMNKFKAANDRYPKDYDEFMNEVIKANGIALPALPFYQEYFYDPNEHKLMVREYPDRKAGPLPK